MPPDFNPHFQDMALKREMREAGVVDVPDIVDASAWIRDTPPPSDPILESLFDTGDKVPIIGSSKSRKTFFALQLALALAARQATFLRWKIPQVRRVLFVQLEVKTAHFWRRVHAMARVLGISPSQIGDRLAIANVRGQTITPAVLLKLAREHKADVVIVDPIYKLLTGDENKAMDVKPLFAAFDQIIEEVGATVIYVHHNPKGVSGDRDTRDRGAGSGVIARDYDAALYIDEHKDGDDLFVVTTILRNYAPQPAFTIRWDEGRFMSTEDAPVVRTSKNKTAGGRPPISDEEAVAKVFANGPLQGEEMEAKLMVQGLTRANARILKKKSPSFTQPGRSGRTFYGTPEQIEALQTEHANPRLTTKKGAL